MLVLDDARHTVWRARIDAYGIAHVDVGREFHQPLRWPDHYYDAETGRHDNRFRTYSPEFGRYLQCDPLGHTLEQGPCLGIRAGTNLSTPFLLVFPAWTLPMPTPALLRRLPAPSIVRSHLRVLAMLDAIVSPSQRSFEYHPQWRKDEQMGAFKDAEGDCFFAWFCAHGAVIRGFAHESPMSPYRVRPPQHWPAIWDGLPASLAYAKTEPAFGGDDVTFACWAPDQAGFWQAGKVKPPKGKEVLAAVNKQRAEGNPKKRPLTPAQENRLRNNLTTMEVKRDMHVAGRTYGKKGGQERVDNDAGDLHQAAKDDLAAHRDYVRDNGGDVKDFNKSAADVHQGNREKGVYDNPVPSKLWE